LGFGLECRLKIVEPPFAAFASAPATGQEQPHANDCFSASQHLGIELDDALEIGEQTEV